MHDILRDMEDLSRADNIELGAFESHRMNELKKELKDKLRKAASHGNDKI